MDIPITVLPTLAPNTNARDFGLVHSAGLGSLEKRLDDVRSQAAALGADAIVGFQVRVEGRASIVWGSAVQLGR